jgi:hypothetical protein
MLRTVKPAVPILGYDKERTKGKQSAFLKESMTMSKTLAFLHTSPVHIATFDRLLAESGTGVVARHIVDESLLDEARAAGAITPALEQRIAAVLRDASAPDGAVVLCTCSTIGGSAEEAGARAGGVVLRVDRPMAERAVALGDRILVAAALASTLAPTRALIQDAARAAGKPIELRELLCEPAWAFFERGDLAGYAQAIANQLRADAGDAEVIVLAQASMAAAAPLCADLGVPILSSPRLGLEAALAAVAKNAS